MARIVFQDEEGQNLNRYLITPTDGSAPFLADLTRAATITHQGTPYNKEVGDHFLQVEDGTPIQTFSCTKTGTVYALSGSGSNGKFVADAAYAFGDTFTVNGVEATALSSDNSSILPPGFFAFGETVSFMYDMNIAKIYFNKAVLQNDGRLSGSTIGPKSLAFGQNNTSSGHYSFALGLQNISGGESSPAIGYQCVTTNSYEFAHGFQCKTLGQGGFAHGDDCQVQTGGFAVAMGGYGLRVTQPYSMVIGEYNSAQSSGDAFAIGNGKSDSSRSNAFRVTDTGRVYGLSSFNSSGADYSEFFEWQDENPDKEDRIGHFVALDGEKIKYANDGDYIIGIISGTPAVIGDHPSESWHGRWLKDIFGRIQYHEVQVPDQTDTITHEDGTTETVVIIPAHTEQQPIPDPEYDPAKEAEYANRESRPEWATVGMLGKLVCIDDGTCEVNGYCKPVDGIATKADAGYRVLARLDDTHVKVLIK